MADLIDNLIDYVNEVKPYHTKIYGVEVEYRAIETIKTTVSERILLHLEMGVQTSPDLTPMVLGSNWDSGRYDDTQWDDQNGLILRKGSNSMHEVIGVGITEKLTFDISIIGTKSIEVDHQLVGNTWDNTVDGVVIVESNRESIYVDGDLREVFNLLTNFKIIDTGINDGVVTIQDVIFDEVRNLTQIRLTSPLFDMSPRTGKVAISLFDIEGWDGDLKSKLIPKHQTDILAASNIAEEFTIIEGESWDSTGWDSTGWDSANIILNGSTKYNKGSGWEYLNWDQYYPWDADGYLPGKPYDSEGSDQSLWDSDTIISPVADNRIGVVVFSAEDIPPPMIYKPL